MEKKNRQQTVCDYIYDNYVQFNRLRHDVVSNKVLILTPFDYNPKKRRISRAECVALNNMAAEICNSLSSVTSDTIRQSPPADEK